MSLGSWRGVSAATLIAAGLLGVNGCSGKQRAFNEGGEGSGLAGAGAELGMNSLQPGDDDTIGAASDSTDEAVGVPRSCQADTDCLTSAPSCVAGTCTCTLAAAELSSDEKNCGQCGNDCSEVDVEATCQQGRCIRPGEPGPTSVARTTSGDVAVLAATSGAAVVKSARHSLVLSSGQAPGGNTVMKSSRFQLKSGFVGASEQ